MFHNERKEELPSLSLSFLLALIISGKAGQKLMESRPEPWNRSKVLMLLQKTSWLWILSSREEHVKGSNPQNLYAMINFLVFLGLQVLGSCGLPS